MNRVLNLLSKLSNFFAAFMLAALFITFILQIFSRYILLEPFGWTLELCLILWIWIVFFGCSFLVRDRDHVTFDLVYNAVPRRIQYIFSSVSIIAFILILSWAILPTFDYIDWMKIRKTTTVKIPILGNKIPLSYIFSIYGIFMVTVIIQYLIKLVRIFKFGLPDQDRFASKIVKDPNER